MQTTKTTIALNDKFIQRRAEAMKRDDYDRDKKSAKMQKLVKRLRDEEIRSDKVYRGRTGDTFEY